MTASLKNYAAICSLALLLSVSILSISIAGNFFGVRPAAAAGDPTNTAVKPNPSTVAIGKSAVFMASVTDTSTGVKTTPTGKVTWSDGGAGGKFIVAGVTTNQCTLTASSSSAGACKITYKPSSAASVGTKITINATYSGDSTHQASSGKSLLTVLRGTSTIISQFEGVTTGSSQLYTALVLDASSGTKSAPTGKVSWKANVTGGVFNSTSCTLAPVNSSASKCSVTYSMPSSPGGFALTGAYSGDSMHVKSSNQAIDMLVKVTLSAGACINGSPCNFNPKNADIKSGNTVIWQNIDGTTHTVTSNTGAFGESLPPGNIFSQAFSSTGSFGYHCSIHPFMTGVVNSS